MKVRERISRFVKDKKYEQYLFFHFLILVSLPLLIMTVITYYIYLHSEDEKSQYMLKAYAGQIKDTCSTFFADLKEYYLDIVNGDIYHELLNRQSPPWDSLEMLVDFQKALEGGRNEGSVKSYCFINVRYNWVLCNYGMYSMETLKNEEEIQQFIRNVESSSDDILWMDNSNAVSHYQNGIIGYGYADLYGELLILKSENFLGELEGILVVQMRLTDIGSSIGMYSDLGYDTIIISCEEILAGRETQYAQEVLGTNGIIEEHPSGKEKRYEVKEVYDETNGLSYLIVFDTYKNRQRMILLTCSAVLFTVTYVFLLIILKKVTNKVSEPFWKLKENNEEQREKIKEFFVINLLKGIWEEERINRYMEKYTWRTCGGYRLMLIMPENGEAETEKILTRLPKEIRESCFILPVKYRDYIAVIVGAEDEIQVEYKAAVLFQSIAQYADETFQSKIFVGISGHFTSLQDCSIAVNQCLEVMMFRIKEHQEKSAFAVYDDLALKTRNKEPVFAGAERELFVAISEKNTEKSSGLLHSILRDMKVYDLWGIDREIYVYRLVMSILSIPQKEEIPLSEIFPDNRVDIFDMKERIFDNDKLECYISQKIVIPVIEALGRNEASKDTEMVRKVVRLIKDHKGDITLTECAEYLECHPSHLSRVIRKERGIGFQDMLNDEKTERAKHFLRVTNISVAEVAQLTGYQNAQNFIRFFKSQTGVTPAKYRKETENE